MTALIDNLLATDEATIEAIQGLTSEDIPVEFSRQSGKTTTVVHTVEDILIFVTRLFNRPIRIGIFAPQKSQSRTDFLRLKDALSQSKDDLIVISEEERRTEKELSNANELRLADGSYCMIYPIKSTSRPESESFDLIIIEESQDADDTIVLERILPMGASTNAPVVWIGTAGTQECHFYDLIQTDKAMVLDFEQIAADRSRMYEKTGDAKHLVYEQKIRSEIAKHGLNSDQIQRPYFNKWLLKAGMFVLISELQQCRIERPFDDPKNTPGFPAYRAWYRDSRRTAPMIDEYQREHNISDEQMELFRTWTEAPHFFGLDTAKEEDQTVLKIGRLVDGKRVIVRSVGGLYGVNYEDQFDVIKSELEWFYTVAGAIDSTGQGDFMPDKFERNTGYRIYRFKFSLMTKDIGYKSLYQQIVNDGFGYYYQDPAKQDSDQFTADSSDQFEYEMRRLVKDYRGEYMMISHPDVKGEHDDHPDATMLMNSAFDSYYSNSGIVDYYSSIVAEERDAQMAAIAEANKEAE